MAPPRPRTRKFQRPGAGSIELVVRGRGRRSFGDLYHQLLNHNWPQLLVSIIALYLTANGLFATAYLLAPGSIENARPGSFRDAFFFSIQTMATIGYGKMAPVTLFANVMVTVEALTGMVGFAMVTGLVFAKFSRPTARVLFSNVAVIAPRDGVSSLLFRMANERSNLIIEAHMHLVLVRNERTNEGEDVRRFYDLPLVRDHNPMFWLSWTAVHQITKDSLLYGATRESLEANQTQLIASLSGIDETFAQTIHARFSYEPKDILWGKRFVDILSQLPDGHRQIDYDKFHQTVAHEPPRSDSNSD